MPSPVAAAPVLTSAAGAEERRLPAWVLAVGALLLFVIWSNSFIAMSYLLGGEAAPRRLDWIGLTTARFAPAALLTGAYCLLVRRRESLELIRAHWRRLVVCALLVVPAYNLPLYYAQQSGVPAPVASLTTTLVPLFVMVLAALFLGERLTARRVAGFAVAAAGMVLISLARRGEMVDAYPLLIAIAALAPLAWSSFSVLSKPLAGRASPLLWSYLVIACGGLFILPLLPLGAGAQLARLDLTGWLAVLYLTLPCTVLGFAVWTWLLRHLPATTVGLTVFLNPPLTTLSKILLAALFPAAFVFQVAPREWLGGAVTLCGLGIALSRKRRPGNAP